MANNKIPTKTTGRVVHNGLGLRRRVESVGRGAVCRVEGRTAEVRHRRRCGRGVDQGGLHRQPHLRVDRMQRYDSEYTEVLLCTRCVAYRGGGVQSAYAHTQRPRATMRAPSIKTTRAACKHYDAVT